MVRLFEAKRSPGAVNFGVLGKKFNFRYADPPTISIQSENAIEYLRGHGFNVEDEIIPGVGHERHGLLSLPRHHAARRVRCCPGRDRPPLRRGDTSRLDSLRHRLPCFLAIQRGLRGEVQASTGRRLEQC